MIKKRTGRPPKFENEEAFRKAIGAYFSICEKTRTMPNKAGLCVQIDITRDTYNEYKKKAGFSDILKAAERVIEDAWVQRLAGNAPTGAIFYLKNAFKEDYRDKQEFDHTNAGKAFVLPAEIITKNQLSGSGPN